MKRVVEIERGNSITHTHTHTHMHTHMHTHAHAHIHKTYLQAKMDVVGDPKRAGYLQV